MDTSTTIAAFSLAIDAAGAFYKVLGNRMQAVRAKNIADLDREFLGLEQQRIEEALERLGNELKKTVEIEKSEATQDLIQRGLYNSTVKDSVLKNIERESYSRFESAAREVARAKEEIGLLVNKIYLGS